jgi:LuxR family transcriptional regulator, maltose regulon positive regulatory protein
VADRTTSLTSPGGPLLIDAKLRAPLPREGTVPRPDLIKFLNAGSRCKLTLLSAPTGFGKTTLLTQWRAAEVDNRPFAWVTLDAGDQDPIRLCVYVVEAIDRVQPGFGDGMWRLLRTSGVDFKSTVLPRLVNELASLPRRIVVVFDDYHSLERGWADNPTNFVLEHLPDTVQFVISSRTEPSVPLGRLRASGQLAEIRAVDLAFGEEEAGVLLRATLGAELDREDLEILVRRTEGWSAGLYLAALSLRQAPDIRAAIYDFAGDDRHVVDYLTEEVLARQRPEVRRFLLRTSILEQFTAPLCDAVRGEGGSLGLLEELEQSNLFLVPLDEKREWYRYHNLFADLLRLELRNSEPKSLPVLHKRAASWYLEAGAVEDAVRHTLASRDFRVAGEMIARHWVTYLAHGRRETLRSWIAQIPEVEVMGYPPLALVQAWLSALGGEAAGFRRWLAVAENGSYDGRLPDGTTSLESGAAVVRSGFAFGDVRRTLEAARRASELEVSPESPWRAVVPGTLGYALYWAGEADESRRMLEESLRVGEDGSLPPTARLLFTGFLALVEYDAGRVAMAERLAVDAMDYADFRGLNTNPEGGVAHVVLGMVLASRRRLREAAQKMERGISFRRLVGEHNGYPHALLAYAPIRQALGDRAGARALFREASALIEGYEVPGRLHLDMRDRVERKLRLVSTRRGELGQDLSEQELRVVTLPGRGLQRPQIADILHLSVNTVKSHLRSVYRKLGASSREEAVDRARRLDLLP